MTALADHPLSADDDDGSGLGDPLGALGILAEPAAGTCTRKPWCLYAAGHRGGCRKYADGDPRRKVAGGGSSAGARSVRGRASGTSRTSSAAPARRPTRPSQDVMAPALWSFAYGGLGQLVEAHGPDPSAPPVGRVMQFQAIDAGERIHRLLGRVPVYKQAASLAGGGLLTEIAELVAAPLLAGFIAGNPAAQAMCWPMLAASLQASALKMAKAQREQLATMDTVAEYGEEVSAIMEQLAGSLFAPREPAAGDAGPDQGQPGG